MTVRQVTLDIIQKDWDLFLEKRHKIRIEIDGLYRDIQDIEFIEIRYGEDEEDGWYDLYLHFLFRGEQYYFAWNCIGMKLDGFVAKRGEEPLRKNKLEKILNEFFIPLYGKELKEYAKQSVSYHEKNR